jgi:hypothetical protein
LKATLVKCARGDSNPHAHRTMAPKAIASAVPPLAQSADPTARTTSQFVGDRLYLYGIGDKRRRCGRQKSSAKFSACSRLAWTTAQSLGGLAYLEQRCASGGADHESAAISVQARPPAGLSMNSQPSSLRPMHICSGCTLATAASHDRPEHGCFASPAIRSTQPSSPGAELPSTC